MDHVAQAEARRRAYRRRTWIAAKIDQALCDLGEARRHAGDSAFPQEEAAELQAAIARAELDLARAMEAVQAASASAFDARAA